jgi:ribosomal protein S18 acetylase RimI-like enzyme
MAMKIEMHSRPTGPIAEEIIAIVERLTGDWFTADVAPATRRDLLFQDTICVRSDGRICSFVMFTSHDGALHITLMGTLPECRGRGFGTSLIDHLVAHAMQLGFDQIVTFTVPPAAKPVFRSTLDFYKRRGFRVVKEYTELWQSGALELRMDLTRINRRGPADEAGDDAGADAAEG